MKKLIAFCLVAFIAASIGCGSSSSSTTMSTTSKAATSGTTMK